MRLVIVAVGRDRSGPFRDAYDLYVRRLSGGGLLGPLDLAEVEPKRPATGAALKRQEADLLLAAVPKGAKVVALDERGATPTSEDFAARLGEWRDQGCGTTAFLVGGADGLDEGVRHRADWVVALGRLTWPHLLVRLLLAEQLYRADTILSGHPYHRS